MLRVLCGTCGRLVANVTGCGFHGEARTTTPCLGCELTKLRNTIEYGPRHDVPYVTDPACPLHGAHDSPSHAA